MFDVLDPARETPPGAHGTAMTARTPDPTGGKRLDCSRDAGFWMMRMLDEIDYGVLLVAPDAQVAYMNHAARLELDGQYPLHLLDNILRAHRVHRALDVAPLYDALAAAQRGLRRLVTLGEGK